MFEQLGFLFAQKEAVAPDDMVEAGGRSIPISYHRHPTARRYKMYLRADRTLRVTIPRRGSRQQAWDFVRKSAGWIERALQKLEARMILPKAWQEGTTVLLRGEEFALGVEERGGQTWVRIGLEVFPVRPDTENLRPLVEAHLNKLAQRELPGRVYELAAQEGLKVNRVTVRNQSSRWGSCSIRGNVSLNWRLIQVPPEVRDYVILHELMHLREMNHSSRYWALVEAVCPRYREWERWIKVNAARLGL
jgi:predicted metal-dependent hydrolase